jgi:lipopolysaccharide biosynthesis protein
MGRNFIVAFYLPSFYPFKENDEFWGNGFTEWEYVKRATPNFEGHLQPNIPVKGGELNHRMFLMDQMELAKANSISAFCIYSYWFNGRKVMTRAFEYVSLSDETPINFCIAWANGSWTRSWDGVENDVLIRQEHFTDSDANFIDDHFSVLSHPNYLKINGKLALLIYRPHLMQDPKQTVENIRERARELGLGELTLLMVQFFGERDPRLFGFDGAVQFPPNLYKDVSLNFDCNSDFSGCIYSYDEVAEKCVASEPDFVEYQGVMPGWDNTPRKGNRSHIYHGATAEKFRSWMSKAFEKMISKIAQDDDRVLFINAWNEWGEGAHLEPGLKDEYDSLLAVKTVFEKFRN